MYIIIYLNRAVERKSSNGFNIEKKYLKRKKQKLKIKKERLMNLITIFINLVMIKKNYELLFGCKTEKVNLYLFFISAHYSPPQKKNPRHVIFLPPP